MLDHITSHKSVLFEHVATGSTFFLDTKEMKVYTPNTRNTGQKLLVCKKVTIDTASNDKVWFKGVHINGEEFFLKVSRNNGKVLFRGKKENCTIKYIC